MFAELQALALVVAAYRCTICKIRSFHIWLKPHTAKRLPVFNEKRNIMRTDFQYSPGALILNITTKSAVKKAGIVCSKFTRPCVIGNHLSRQMLWNSAPLLRSKYVKGFRLKYQV